MENIRIYDSGSATGNAVAQIVMPSRARIRAVHWSFLCDNITDGGYVRLEISRASATEIAVNGAQQCISQISWGSNFVTSGLAQGGVNMWVPVDVAVVQGQIIYMHAVATGTVAWEVSALVWY